MTPTEKLLVILSLIFIFIILAKEMLDIEDRLDKVKERTIIIEQKLWPKK